ncbi:probable fatty acid-binding protein [Hermetia illucens]|nr:probable fatty acid-binding protein [Hermetia illucens]
MACWEGKKYKLEKSENFDEYMKALGVGAVKRKFGNSMVPTVYMVKNGDEYELTSASTVKTSVLKFKPGVEFEDETMDGRKVRTICRFETPNKLVQEEKGDKPGTIIREFTDTELTMTLTVGDVTSVRHYKVI